MGFCFATFCFGERYYEQVNRFINDISESNTQPILVVVTDKPDMIKKEHFVRVFNVNDFNKEYTEYANNYYDFDFSVKRYALLASFNEGFTKIVLVDCDVRVNYSIFNEENIKKSFEPNSIMGPVTYNFNQQINTNSELGRRLVEYENHFNIHFNKEKLNYMPEDCIQYINIDKDKFLDFISTWDKCIDYKKTKPLRNVPAGNIDEMCFSALSNNINVGNNSNKSLNIIYAQHDKWY